MEKEHLSLILKQLAGEISPEETDTLNRWISASEENKLLYKQTVQLLEDSENVFETYSPNTQEEWTKLKSKIEEEQLSSPAIIPIWKKQGFKIAASVILVVGLGFGIRLSVTENVASVNTIEIVTTEDVQVIRLSDGSLVHLNVNTTLSYPGSFEGVERNVSLVGEAYFEIETDSTKPFIVFAGNTETQVLGTAFRIKAFKGDDDVEVHVTKGKVRFSVDDTKVVLKKHDKINYSVKKKTHKKSTSNNIDIKWLVKDVERMEKEVEKEVKKVFQKIKKHAKKNKKN
ncbi:MAG: FecR domain-containing protein [Flavobacteriales bacterium]|nr:FecR domain-containing protein [Flavobacteriales bacterium]